MRLLSVFALTSFVFIAQSARAEETHLEHHGAKRATGIALASVGGTILTADAVLTAFVYASATATRIEGASGGGGGYATFADLALCGLVAVVGVATLVPGIVLVATSRTRTVADSPVVRPVDDLRPQATLALPRVWAAPVVAFRF